ncbi:NUDIX domain-containing protein [Hoyosella sp. G463]|uniref:NUDIX domain-containing protein n=1 Tax=Lolliginicoccus lacisalsi TaxID=2742202 RepID=A0A927JC10_9ACTN|nr:NUDIX domain-containing protein [Lolliginicoccus lacisalsi]
MNRPITVAAVCILHEGKRILLVRKAGTQRFMLPGGKPEPGESIHAAAIRECREEISVELGSASLRFLGRWTAPAANERNRRVDATVYVTDTAALAAPHGYQVIQPGGEIAEIRWLELSDDHGNIALAPLLADKILPELRRPLSIGQVRP